MNDKVKHTDTINYNYVQWFHLANTIMLIS